jgi:hypothetical protein
MIDYTQILSRKFAGSEWTLNGDDYSGLTWLSESTKPTKKQLDDLWPEVAAEIQNEKEEKIAKKAAAEAKLAALGIDVDDLKALGLG